MNASPVVIRAAITAREHAEGLAYIDRTMRETFRCDPPPTRGVLLLAYRGEDIVGSLALESRLDDEPFALESYYGFERDAAPFPFQRSRIVQGTRWISVQPGVGRALFHAGLAFAHGFGKRYMLFEAKPPILERFRARAIEWRPMERAELLLEKVREHVGAGGMGYYLEPPAPILGMLELGQFLDTTD